jgi:23S rRNA (adenine2503-C2)-methyltransferase
VYIPEPSRGTLCVSSQVGCALNCTFCSTGAQGFNRNLSSAEIIGQVWRAAKALGNVTHQQRRITNVVMMGMGEPLLNFDAVVRAMSVMRDDLGFGTREQARHALDRGHGPDDRQVVRGGGREPRGVAARAVRRAARRARAAQQEVPDRRAHGRVPALPGGAPAQQHHVRVHADAGRERQARACARAGQAAAQGAVEAEPHPVQPVPGTRYQRSDRDAIEAFQKIVLDGGILRLLRRTRGEDIDAACGQLAGQVVDRTRRSRTIREQNIVIEHADAA